MDEFGLVRKFDIDDGELDSCDKPTCFVLGYELAQVDQMIATGRKFSATIHHQNLGRVEHACKQAGRNCIYCWAPDDISESWMVVNVW